MTEHARTLDAADQTREGPAMMLIEDVDTPAVVIDLGRAERNIAKLQAHCDEHGLANRPHIKTHKLPLLAHATVVSMATSDRGVVDTGSKMLTSDRVPQELGEGYGHILEYPDAVIRELSEEHGVVDWSRCTNRPFIGERVRIVPNHVCPVSNLVDDVVLHRDGVVEAVVPVAARGKH